MIEVRHLTKRYGRTVALDNISFDVARGEVVGFLGPNGAGKSTAMRILATYLPASGGRVTVAGLDVFADSLAVRQQIGYLPENTPLYDDLRVQEYLGYRGRLKGLYGRRLHKRTFEVMDICGLEDMRDRIIRHLSKGYRQRVGLADALIHNPPLLILDEPTIGLDPNQMRQIRQFIKSLGQRHTVLLSTHILSEVEAICDRVLIVRNGRLAASDRTEHLLARMKDGQRLLLEVQGPPARIEASLLALPGIAQVTLTADGPWWRCACNAATDEDLRPALSALVAREGWPLRTLQRETAHLEDVFAELTR